MTTSEVHQRISVAIAMSVKATNELVLAAELGHSVARKQLIGYAVESLQKALDEIEPMQDQTGMTRKVVTFDEFVERLQRAGWNSKNDAQHKHIRELWDSLPSLDFRAMAVRVLRQHVRCGDQYPDDGWPEVNEALAQYAIEQRQKNPRPHHGSGSGWCRCPPDTKEE